DHRDAAGIEDLLPGGNRLPPGVHRSHAARPTGRGAAADRLRRLPRPGDERAGVVMRVSALALPGVLLLEHEVFEDARGSFYESWNRSEEHTSELQSPYDIVCRLLLEK